MADIAELIVALKLRDGISSGLGRLNGQLKGMQGGLSQVGKGIGQVGSGLSSIATRGAVAAAGGLAYVANAAIEFEDAFTGVAKTVDASEAELAALSDEIRAMARTMPIGTTELAAIAEQAGALGIAVDDIDEFTRVAALLGTTTNVSSEEAATALGQLSNVLNLTEQDYERFGATLVDLGNKGASTEADILAITARAGAAGDLIGLSADQVLSFGSAVANLGIEAEAGGSALQKFFIDTLTNLQDDDTLKVMAETAGTTGAAFKKAFEDDAAGALETFLIGLGQLDEAAQIETLQSLGFNDVRITRMLLGFANNTDNLTDSLNVGAAAWKANSALQDEAERKFANTASQLKILKNNVDDAAITIGNELLPVITDLTTDLVGFLNKPETQRGIREFAENLAGGIRDLATEIKNADFGPLIDTLKGAAGVAKAAFDAFNALPAPVKQLALAALVANKVTGGAVGSIAGGLTNIAGGLLKIAFERGSSPANPLWVQSIGGLPGGGGGVPGGGGGGVLGGLKTGVALASPLLVAGAAIEVINFETMRTEQRAGLQGILDEMPRTPEQIDESMQRIEDEINRERPLLDQIIFNTNVRPQLEQELAELRTTRAEQARNARLVSDRHKAAVEKGTFSQINEFRRASNDARTNANKVAARTDALKEVARDRLNNLALRYSDIGARTNAKLDGANSRLTDIKNKKTAVNVNVNNTIPISLSVSAVTQQIIRLRQAQVGTGFTEGII